MKNLETFLKSLPELAGGEKELNAIFVTYNEVSDHEDGPVNTGKSGLNIIVQSGNLRYSEFSGTALVAGLATGNPFLAQAGGYAMDEEGCLAQSKVKAKTEEHLTKLNNKNLLAVVYAGLSAFQESFVYAREIRKSNPQAKVVVLTCNCDQRNKEQVLDDAIKNREINDAVMTWECGGRNGMRAILEGLIASWPNSTSTTN